MEQRHEHTTNERLEETNVSSPVVPSSGAAFPVASPSDVTLQEEPPSSLLLVPQRLGFIGLCALLSLTSMLAQFALDMYLPATPAMAEYFQTTDSLVNLTLVVFFIFMPLGLLVFGTVSEKYGRKPVLLFGNILFMLSSLASFLAPNIFVLILARTFQAIGAGASSSVATAIVKDCFSREIREKVLIAFQVIFVIGPIIAPVVGAQILRFFDWRVIFLSLFVMGAGVLVASCLFRETLPTKERYQGTILGNMGRLVVVAKNKNFSYFLLMTGMVAAPFNAYISFSSYIYVDFFGLTEQVYSYFFAVMAALSVFGPLLYMVAAKRCKPRTITKIFIGIALVCAVAMLCLGGGSPYLFFAVFVPFYLVSFSIRPFAVNILLNAQEGDTGPAASLINFVKSILGLVGIGIASLPWPNYVIGLGVAMGICQLIAIVFFFLLSRGEKPVRGL